LSIQNTGGKVLRNAKIFQIVCLIIVGVFAENIYRNPETADISNHIGLSANIVHTVTIGFVVLSILSLAAGYLVYRVMLKARIVSPILQNKGLFPFFQNMGTSERIVFSAHFLLIVMFTVISGFGLILGIFGDGWKITLAFFVVPAVLLILTFPTQKRWNTLLAKFTEPADGK
jgi:hypothetical protein